MKGSSSVVGVERREEGSGGKMSDRESGDEQSQAQNRGDGRRRRRFVVLTFPFTAP